MRCGELAQEGFEIGGLRQQALAGQRTGVDNSDPEESVSISMRSSGCFYGPGGTFSELGVQILHGAAFRQTKFIHQVMIVRRHGVSIRILLAVSIVSGTEVIRDNLRTAAFDMTTLEEMYELSVPEQGNTW